MRSIKLLLATTLLTANANAADKPIVAPLPAWVNVTALPKASDSQGEAPVSIILSDQQLKVEAGKQTLYSGTLLRIQTPQGLSAGNLSLPWDPETDELTVHKLIIHRGNETIDILGSGQSFTVVRREANLESATLDGMLTANIQPEGLQVGDVLELAFSISSTDPVLKGHVELVGASWNSIPIRRAHFKAQWPSQLPIAFRQSATLPPLKISKTGSTSILEVTLDNVEAVVSPKYAPARYHVGRFIELSDFRSWADLGALLAPLYTQAATIPAEGPLRTELDKIKAASSDPVKRTEAALALVQDRIRYVGLLMGPGGYVPADAAETWSRRFGDCKGKTAVLLALLKELGVAAEPVAVNLGGGDGFEQRLPMIGLFNHVLVRASIAGRTYWLDGTRTGDTSLARLRTPDLGWGLPLVDRGAQLVRMQAAALDQPNSDLTIEIDARAGLTEPAPFKAEAVFRADNAIETKLSMANMTPDLRDRTLREYWKARFDFVDIKSVGSTFDAATGEQRLTVQGMAQMDWSNDRYETDQIDLGYKADFSRSAGPDQEAPYATFHPFYDRTVETILLPPGFPESKDLTGAKIEEVVAGVEYRRAASLIDNVFRIEASSRSVMSEFPAKDAPAAEKRLRELAENTVYLRRPQKIGMLMNQGFELLEADKFDQAIKIFDEILATEPRNVYALANRGIAYVWKDKFDNATRDLDAASALASGNVVVLRARGLMAEKRSDHAAAIAAFSDAIARDASDSFSLGHRAIAYQKTGDRVAALADSERALKLESRWRDLRLMRARIFAVEGKEKEALDEAAALSATLWDDSWAQIAAGRIYGALDHKEEALKAFDRALELEQGNPYIYVNRAEIREKDDFAGREADYDNALKLDPDFAVARSGKAQLLLEKGDWKGAIALYSDRLAADPKDVDILSARGIAHARAGDMTSAQQDFAAARAQSNDAASLNSLCWKKAIAGVALEAALEECDMALAKAPDDAAIMDSRALVLLRLGRIDDAIAAYDSVLAKSPKLPSSLFGRAIAWARRGDDGRAKADRLAAIAIRPNIEKTFIGYGVAFPVVRSSPAASRAQQ